jgi:superoxide reductase
MTEKNQVYKCNVCGNMVDVVHNGAGTLVCCGQNMDLLTENTTDAATEKHVPVITKTEKGATIKVGSVDHPMDEDHHIEWIEATIGERTIRKYLAVGEEAIMNTCGAVTSARAYCNLHGLWKSE